MRHLVIITTFLFLSLPAVTFSLEAPSLELGKTLFETTELGSSGNSCQTCHPAGKGLDQTGDFADHELKDIINACIRDALKGELIAVESQEMDALLKYVRKFQKNK